jgi:hypothetical protein
MAASSPWPMIHGEREALAADLAPLTGEDFNTGSNLLIGSKRRIAGLTVKATDLDWSTGSGPAVTGPALSPLLAMTGRSAALADLSGEGVATLRSRR